MFNIHITRMCSESATLADLHVMTPMDMTIALRPATIVDIDFLLELRKTTMTAHMRNSGFEVTDEANLQRVLFRYELASIIELGEIRIGLLKLEKHEELWTLHQIQLLPEFQSQGIGKTLLSGIVDSARKNGVEVNLHVLRANPARRLYERLGFIVTREAEHAYEMRLGVSNPLNGTTRSLRTTSKNKNGS